MNYRNVIYDNRLMSQIVLTNKKGDAKITIDTDCDNWKGVNTMVDAMVIADRLIKLRGNTQRDEVAEACGISKSALTMYELGKRIPRDEIKVKLARYYNTTVETIFFTC